MTAPKFRPRLLLWGGAAVLAAGTGCTYQTYQRQPLDPVTAATAFDARTLGDPGLRDYLLRNRPGVAVPEPDGAWDVESLTWAAFYFSPSLGLARAQWESARAASVTASARPNPTIALTPGYSTNSGSVSPWFPAVTVDFPIETSGKRGHREQAARSTAESQRQAIFTAAWKTRSELRRALVTYAAAQRRAERLRAEADLQRHASELAERRVAAGAAAASEVDLARLATLRADAAVADADRQLPTARQQVAAAIGVAGQALARVKLPDVPPARLLTPEDLADARRQALRSRPDLVAALARYDSAEAALALEVSKQYPDIHLVPGYQWDQGQDKWSMGIGFELPIFHRNEGPIGEAAAHRRELAAQFLSLQAQAIAEIDAAAAAHSAAVAQRDLLRRAREQLLAQQQHAQSRRRNGAADESETVAAELDVAAGELALTDAETQVELASGQLEDALQIPFDFLPAVTLPSPAQPFPRS